MIFLTCLKTFQKTLMGYKIKFKLLTVAFTTFCMLVPHNIRHFALFKLDNICGWFRH